MNTTVILTKARNGNKVSSKEPCRGYKSREGKKGFGKEKELGGH